MVRSCLGKVFVSSVLATVAAGWAGAADLGTLSLSECKRLALQNSHEIRSASLAVRKSEAVLTQMQALYYPQVKATGRYVKMDDPYRFENYTLRATSPGLAMALGMPADTELAMTVGDFKMSGDEMVMADVTAELPLFTWGKITNANKLAKVGIDVEKAKLQATQNRLLRDVISAYKAVVLSREARKTLLETIAEMELFYKTAKQDFDNGASTAPEKDILQIQYDLDDMKTWLPELNKMESLSLEGLKVAMGVAKDDQFTVTGDFLDYPTLQLDEQALLQKALDARPEVKMIQDAIEASTLQKKIAAVSNLPMVGAFAQYSWNHDNFEPNQAQHWAVGIGAEMALFDGFKGYGQYKEADADVLRYREQYALLKDGIRFQVKQAVTEVNQFHEQLKIREEARDKAVKQVKVVRQGYQFGMVPAKDVNESQVQKRWSDAYVLFKKLEYVNAIARLNDVVGSEVHGF